MARCPKCFLPLVSEIYRCPRCHGVDGAVPVYGVADYNSNLSYSLLHRFKFLGDRRIAGIVAMLMQKALYVLDPKAEAVVVPVPCSGESLKRRGWDQMLEVCGYLDRPTLGILENVQHDESQQKLLDRSQRIAKGMEKRFARSRHCGELSKETLDGSVIVVDDIATTFSTIMSAAECLKEIGFKDVKAAVWLYDYKA